MDAADLKALKPDALTPAEVEAKAETLGVGKAGMSFKQSFVLAIMAGVFIACGGMFMLLVRSDGDISFIVKQLLGGFTFCLGLFLVICAGAELFTGNTMMIAGKLSSKYSWGKMLKSWVVVYIGNLIGSLIIVAILYYANYDAVNGGAVGTAMVTVASAKASLPLEEMFFKGIMCNFLVCLAVWIGYAGRTIVDKFFAVLLPITAFVACGFEHCVANMFLLPMGLVTNMADSAAYEGVANVAKLDIASVSTNIGMVTLGNIVGGAIMVGFMYWLAFHKKAEN